MCIIAETRSTHNNLDSEFLSIIGQNATAQLIASRNIDFAFEAGIWVPERNEVWFSSLVIKVIDFSFSHSCRIHSSACNSSFLEEKASRAIASRDCFSEYTKQTINALKPYSVFISDPHTRITLNLDFDRVQRSVEFVSQEPRQGFYPHRHLPEKVSKLAQCLLGSLFAVMSLICRCSCLPQLGKINSSFRIILILLCKLCPFCIFSERTKLFGARGPPLQQSNLTHWLFQKES